MSDVKCRIGGEVEMFNTTLVGMIDTETNCIIIRQQKAGPDAPDISVDDLIKNLEDTIKNVGLPTLELQKKLPEGITGNIEVAVNEVYLKIISGDGGSCEFAIWLSMSSTDVLKKKFPAFTFTKGYLKLWSTSDPDILEEMQIAQIEKMFSKAKAELTNGDKPVDPPNPKKDK